MECDFCKTNYDGPYRTDCAECGYPVHGNAGEQAQFTAANEALKNVIDEAESALSWARFALLWPWLTALALAAWQFLNPPVDLLSFGIVTFFCAIFIGCYFAAPWRPVPILILALTTLIVLLLVAFLRTGFVNVWYIIPAFLLVAYSNGLYTVWKSQKALEQKRQSI
jgi:hypothetical protein